MLDLQNRLPAASACLAAALILLPGCPNQSSSPHAPARSETDPIRLAAASEPYAPPAGRSAIPAPGETIRKPIPPQKLGEPMQGVPPKDDEIVPWAKAPQHLGHVVTVEGKIVGTHLVRSGQICFLNFHEDYRDHFYIAMFREAFEGLPQPPDDYYLHKTVRVTGLVKTHKNRPQIEVHAIEKIQVVE